MTVEFVRAVGEALGAARDSFGAGPPGAGAPPPNSPSVPTGLAPGSGRAVQASNIASDHLNTQAIAVRQNDASTDSQLANMVAANNSGRAKMNGIIGSATSDATALAPGSNTPQGFRNMVTAMQGHLQNTKQTLQDKSAEATTHAANANSTAQAYHSVFPAAGSSAASPASGAPMGAMPLASLGGLPGVLGSQSDGSGGQGSAQRQGLGTGAATGNSAVDAVIARALSQHGTPYSWGGGGKHGPGPGDDGSVGFDCSSLMQYAFAGAGVDLPRTTYHQIGLGRPVSPGDIRAGDLIFSSFGEGGNAGPGHVQLAISPNRVVEAPHTGANVQTNTIPGGHIVVRRILH